jgi:hypothetical protein
VFFINSIFSNQVLCFEPFFSFFKYYYYVFSCFC